MMRRTLLVVVCVLALLGAGIPLAGILIKLPGEARTPAGLKRNQALYVTVRDGTRIALDLWLPETFDGGHIPTILRATRYGRAQRIGPLGRVLWKLGILRDEGVHRQFGPTLGVDEFTSDGYAVVVVDARGSGASFGSRRAECAPEEIADFGDVLDWITRQPWSDGNVGAWGISQDGLNIEMLASLEKPQLKAIATLYTTLDSQFTTAGFGGVYNRENVKRWAERNRLADANEPLCPQGQLACRLLNFFVFEGIKPVDGSDGPKLLAQAIATRRNYDVVEGWGSLLYRGDPLGKSGLSSADVMPYGVRTRIEHSGVPIFSIYGWMDAGLAFSGLVHFNNFSNPQFVLMGPFSHGALFNTDPYLPAGTPPQPGLEQQLRQVARFFDQHVKRTAPAPRLIRYYTLGARGWRDTPVWPPTGLTPVSYFLSADATAQRLPSGTGTDLMRVDFNSTSGKTSRYRSIIEATDIVYPERAAATQALLHYDSEPMAADMELTGSPVAKLYIASTREDGAFYVYVDDVGPDGKLVYLTEGVLRGLFHKTSSRPAPYRTLGVDRAYWKEDAEPLQPGQRYAMEIEMFPVSALVRKGHRLRFSLAGADADSMPRIPATGPAPEVTVYRMDEARSEIIVPLAPFLGSQR